MYVTVDSVSRNFQRMGLVNLDPRPIFVDTETRPMLLKLGLSTNNTACFAWMEYGYGYGVSFSHSKLLPFIYRKLSHFLNRLRIPSVIIRTDFPFLQTIHKLQPRNIKGFSDGNLGESDEDDDLCPVECVREFKTDDEFFKILEKAKETNSLVVVDFYRTSCGSCKYIEQGFSKLCKGSGDQDAPVIFLKHNVIDEYDEQSEVAERLRIKSVPLFHFYKNGDLLEAFPTRDKERIFAAILKYSSVTSVDD